MFQYSEYFRKRYEDRMALAFEILGDKCVNCGSIDNLEFDHIDPKSKIAELSNLTRHSLKKFLDEVAKCQVLCSSCHHDKSTIESGKQLVPGTHGTLSSYRFCRCTECKKAKSSYMRIWHQNRSPVV